MISKKLSQRGNFSAAVFRKNLVGLKNLHNRMGDFLVGPGGFAECLGRSRRKSWAATKVLGCLGECLGWFDEDKAS
jgi:hypothetical protein